MDSNNSPPVIDCPNSLKALVYFNFVLLFFVGIMFFGDLKNVDDLDEVGFLGLLYAFFFCSSWRLQFAQRNPAGGFDRLRTCC